FPKARQDRMNLLKAARINTSPVFGTFADPHGELESAVAAAGAPAAEGVEGASTYKLWRVDAPEKVERLRRAIDASKMLIADGHHRYRVAYEYGRASRLPGAGRVLAYLAADADPGLVVLPTHRLVARTAVSLDRVHELCRVADRADRK